MEELKRNQEKKEKGSLTTPMCSSIEKPAIPPVKPIISKSINTSIDVPQSEGNSLTRVTDAVSYKIGQKNSKIEPSLSSIVASVNSDIIHSKSLMNTSGSPTLASVLHSDKSTTTVPPVVEKKKTGPESGILLSLEGCTETGLNSQSIEETAKHKFLSAFPSNVTKQSVDLPNQLPVNLNEVAQSSKSEDTVQRELQILHLRVASLEATVQNLQKELLHLKNSSLDEHRCRCMQKVNSNEASLVHI